VRRYYQILGVSPDATPEEIRAAWLFSIKAFHPDKFSRSSPEQQRTAHERTKAINEAYGVLSDPIKRSRYDREYTDQPRGPEARPPRSAAPPPTGFRDEDDFRDVESPEQQTGKRYWGVGLLVSAASAAVVMAFIIAFIANQNAPKPVRLGSKPGNRTPTSDQRRSLDLTNAIATPTDAVPTPSVRGHDPINGFVFTNQMRVGRGTLKIANTTRNHAVAKLVSAATNRAVFTVFVGAGGEYVITGIPNGRYRLAFAQGRRWNWNTNGFDEADSSSMFRNSFDFDTTVTNDGAYYNSFEVTLQPVAGGTAPIDGVDPDVFEHL
jgi:DnaJ-like protein